MGPLEPFRNFGAVFVRHPLRAAIGTSALAWFFDPFNWIPTPDQVLGRMIEAYLGPNWSMAMLVASWPFKLFGLAISLGMIWWIGREGLLEQQRLSAKAGADHGALLDAFYEKVSALIGTAPHLMRLSIRLKYLEQAKGILQSEIRRLDGLVLTACSIASQEKFFCDLRLAMKAHRLVPADPLLKEVVEQFVDKRDELPPYIPPSLFIEAFHKVKEAYREQILREAKSTFPWTQILKAGVSKIESEIAEIEAEVREYGKFEWKV